MLTPAYKTNTGNNYTYYVFSTGPLNMESLHVLISSI